MAGRQDGGGGEVSAPPSGVAVGGAITRVVATGTVLEVDADMPAEAGSPRIADVPAADPPIRHLAAEPVAVVGGITVVSDPTMTAPTPRHRERRAARRLQARRVGRIVHHVDPWSVFKVALVLNLCAFVVSALAGVMLWSVAVNLGVVTDVEDFIRSAFALQTFAFDGVRIFRVAVISGLGLVVALTLLCALLAVVFNLVSDIVGGIRFTVIEEESTRPAPPRR